MKPDKKKAATSGEMRGAKESNSQQPHYNNNEDAEQFHIPDGHMPDGPLLHTLLRLLTKLDFTMSADGWLIEPMMTADILRVVGLYCHLYQQVNAAIEADDPDAPTHDPFITLVTPFDGRIEISNDGITRVLLVPGRKADVYLTELRPDQVAGGFVVSSPEGLSLAVDKADAGAAS